MKKTRQQNYYFLDDRSITTKHLYLYSCAYVVIAWVGNENDYKIIISGLQERDKFFKNTEVWLFPFFQTYSSLP